MKKLLQMSLVTIALVAIVALQGSAQVASEGQLTARVISDGMILVGQNSRSSQLGPNFAGSLGYGIGHGVTVYAESGYGWTNFHSNSDLRFVRIPVLGGVTYNFGHLWNSSLVEPYVGVAGGIFNHLLKQDGNTIFVAGNEQKITNFGLEGLVGVNFRVTRNVAFDVRAKYDHVFSDKDRPGIENQEWNNVAVGGGISYNFSL